MYDFGLTNAAVILGLTIPPCLAFLLFAVDRKNGIAFFRSLFLPYAANIPGSQWIILKIRCRSE